MTLRVFISTLMCGVLARKPVVKIICSYCKIPKCVICPQSDLCNCPPTKTHQHLANHHGDRLQYSCDSLLKHDGGVVL